MRSPPTTTTTTPLSSPATDELSDEDYKNFVKRNFKPTAEAASWLCTPYDLRHFNASLLIKEGRLSLQEIATHMGHTVHELSKTYAHDIAEYRGRHVNVQAEIERIRHTTPHGEPLRVRAATLGIALPDPDPDPSAANDTNSTRGDHATALRALVQLNVLGVLTNDELAIKVRQLA